MDDSINFREKARILDEEGMRRVIIRMTHQILEKHNDLQGVAIIGIRTRGTHLARRITNLIEEITKQKVLLGILDITLYRDDLTTIAEQPVVHSTQINFDINQKKVILIDDVLFTGRTIRAAMDALIDFGRPKYIQLAVLVDRGHREFPIRPDFTGKNLPTSLRDIVQVRLKEIDRVDEVVIEEKVSEDTI